MPAVTAVSVEAGVVLCQRALHRSRTRANTEAKAAASPRERLAAASVFVAPAVDDNGIVGGRHAIVRWWRERKTPKKYFRYVQNRGVRIINRFFRKPLNVFNYMRLFLTSRVTKRSKLSAFFFLVSLSNPLMLARSKKLASGVLLLENEVHIS